MIIEEIKYLSPDCGSDQFSLLLPAAQLAAPVRQPRDQLAA
jgi:hypothetical protein